MRWLALVFVVLILALQYPMWLGKGGWIQVRELDRQLAIQRDANARLKARNDRLDAEVGDLKTGYEAIEERARSELGMVRQDEVFFQMQSKPGGPAPADVAKNASGEVDPAKPDAAPSAGRDAPSAAAPENDGKAAGASGMISPVSAQAATTATATPHAVSQAHAATRR